MKFECLWLASPPPSRPTERTSKKPLLARCCLSAVEQMCGLSTKSLLIEGKRGVGSKEKGSVEEVKLVGLKFTQLRQVDDLWPPDSIQIEMTDKCRSWFQVWVANCQPHNLLPLLCHSLAKKCEPSKFYQILLCQFWLGNRKSHM